MRRRGASSLVSWLHRHAIDIGAGVAASVVTARTVFEDTPEVFGAGSEVGTLAYELGLAYVGGWIINLLVNVLPRRRDRLAIYSAVSSSVQQLSGSMSSVLMEMSKALNHPSAAAISASDLTAFTAADIAELCQGTHPYAPAPLLTGMRQTETGVEFDNATWLQYLQYEAERVEGLKRTLVYYFPYFEAELVRKCTAIFDSALLLVLASVRADMPLRNRDLSFLASSLTSYHEMCLALREYWEKHIRPYSVPRR